MKIGTSVRCVSAGYIENHWKLPKSTPSYRPGNSEVRATPWIPLKFREQLWITQEH